MMITDYEDTLCTHGDDDDTDDPFKCRSDTCTSPIKLSSNPYNDTLHALEGDDDDA